MQFAGERLLQGARPEKSGMKAAFRGEEVIMLLAIGVVLLICWALGLFAFHVAGGLIHLLIVLGIILIVVHLVRGRSV